MCNSTVTNKNKTVSGTTPLNFSQSSKIIGDSGASGNFFNIKSIKHLEHVKRHSSSNDSISVTMPDGRPLISTHSGFLRLKNISKVARQVYLFPGLKGSLLAFGPLCDDGCTVTLNKHTMEIRKNDQIILTGTRSNPNGLWYVDLTSNSLPATTITSKNLKNQKIIIPENSHYCCCDNNSIVSSDAPDSQSSNELFMHLSTHIIPFNISNHVLRRANYFRYALMAAPLSSIYTAAKRNYFSFPNVAPEHFNKLPPVPATDRGHMKRLRQNLDSTQFNDTIEFYDLNDEFTKVTLDSPRPRQILVGLTPFHERIHLDATGAFIYSNGSKTWDLIFFDEDSNYIHVEQLRGLSSADYSSAIQAGIDFYRSKKMKITVFRMDNQTSDLVQTLLQVSNQIDVELVPAYSHRALRAERAIGTWKNHKISGLASVDPNCPDEAFKYMNWQFELTINLLRPSGFSDHMSAYQAVHGYYNFNYHPIAPLGIRVEMFNPRPAREPSSSWGEHSLNGYYTGPAMNHHRCFKAFIPTKNSTRISNTLNWYPTKDMIMPGSSPTLDLLDAINNLSQALTTFKNVNIQPNNPSIIDNLLSDINIFHESLSKTNVDNLCSLPTSDLPPPPSDVPVLPIPSQYNHPASHDSDHNLRSRRSKYPEFTILDHKGKKKSLIDPLLFRVKFNDSSREHLWLDFDSVVNTPAFNKYIDSRDHLWHILHNDIKLSSVVKVDIPVPHPTDTFWNAAIDAVFQHRRSKNMAFDYDIQIRYKSNGTTPSFVKWITLSGPSDPITSDAAFLKYLNKTNDIGFIERYIDTSFESKFLHLNSAATTQLAPHEEDHHGLKYLDKGKPLRYDKAIAGKEKDEWIKANSDELDRLFLRTKTMKIIHASEKEKGRIVSYYNPQLTKKIKNKQVLFRVRGTVGGNINDFTGNATAYTASLPSVKILLNAVISDPNANFMSIDAKDFFPSLKAPSAFN